MKLLRWINLHLGFMHVGLRFRIIKFLVRLLSLGQKKFLVTFYGYKYPGCLNNHIDFYTYFFGSYERGILNFLNQNILKSNMTIADVGANLGHHSLFFSAKAKQVISFEPYEKVRSVLENKIAINNISNIKVVPVGLSDENQRLEYFEPPAENSGMGSFLPEHSSKNTSSGIFSDLINGDEYFESNPVNALDFLKVDVEGFEFFVLNGLKNTLIKHRPIIMMEFGIETKKHCGNFERFRALFPDGYFFYELSLPSSSMAKLLPFNFDKDEMVNILCSPTKLTSDKH